ncbi:hypothetical protein [Tenacibaculum soleae]|uniref:hypothetical protein n=1 Tax=Tenacibaculum soleae TaxID=447689 RepID=UPI0022FFE1F0|nr:hypothetical protein [Tenacibaculum soleae]
MNYTLEDKMTSLRAVSLAVLLYIVGYSLKITVLLNDVLAPVITNMLMRYTASAFTGIALSTGLLIVSVNEINKYTPYIISMMDAIMLLLVFDVFTSPTLTEAFTSVFISFFMAFIGYQLVSVFVAKYKQVKASKQQSISELEQLFSDKKQIVSELEQEISTLKQNTCEYCDQTFGSPNALNAHKGRCKSKP